MTDYVAHDGTNNIAVSADVSYLAASAKRIGVTTAEMAAAMEAHGVVPPIKAYVEA